MTPASPNMADAFLEPLERTNAAEAFYMALSPPKEPRWITVDPGEDTGLAIWEDDRLIMGYTLKMEVVAPMLHTLLALTSLTYHGSEIVSSPSPGFLVEYPECKEVWDEIVGRKIERVVCEDWRLYPHVMYTPDGRASHALDWDQCRTARLIGKIELVCMLSRIPLVLQPAKIKETAVAAGAENLYYKPLHENRHQNDAIQHGVFYLVVEEHRAPKDARV